MARFQPIHNGHLQLIQKAVEENDQVLVIIGSIDKLNARNPIPWTIRKEMVEEAIADSFLVEGHKEKIKVVELTDLSDESDNSHDWGFYLYSFVVTQTKEPNFTIYYSEMIVNGRLPEDGVVPESVYKRRETIKAFLNVFRK